ncbi:Serine/threonine-protein phosphatase 7 long form homolog [Linum perenne]
MVTTLLERWRPEMNTFHLVPGEATITLEDVEVLTGLPTTGLPYIRGPTRGAPSEPAYLAVHATVPDIVQRTSRCF